jgi:hypothetical protein
MKKMIVVALVVMALGLILTGCPTPTQNNFVPEYKTVYDFEWGFVGAPGGYQMADTADYNLIVAQNPVEGNNMFRSTTPWTIEEAKSYFVDHKDDDSVAQYIYSIRNSINSSTDFTFSNDNSFGIQIYYIYWSNPTLIQIN